MRSWSRPAPPPGRASRSTRARRSMPSPSARASSTPISTATPRSRPRAVDCTNLPASVARNDNVGVAVNSTGQMDLQGQAASKKSSGHRPSAAPAADLGFVRAACNSGAGGPSSACPRPTRGTASARAASSSTCPGAPSSPCPDRRDVCRDRIRPPFLKGKSVAERARAMISIATPDFREGLERDAHDKGLIPKAYFQ